MYANDYHLAPEDFNNFIKNELQNADVKKTIKEKGGELIGRLLTEGTKSLSDVSRNAASLTSSFGIGIGVGLLGVYLAKSHRKSETAKFIARLFGADVDKMNTEDALKKLTDQDFFLMIRGKVIDHLEEGKISEISNLFVNEFKELGLNQHEAQTVFQDIKDIVFDSQIITTINQNSIVLNRIEEKIDKLILLVEGEKEEIEQIEEGIEDKIGEQQDINIPQEKRKSISRRMEENEKLELELQRANYFYYIENYAKAIEYYDRILEINFNDASTWIAKGKAYLELKNYDKALQCIDKASSLNPKNVHTLLSKAGLLYLSKRYEDSIEAYDQLIEIEPNNADAFLGKAKSLLGFGKIPQSIEWFDKAIGEGLDNSKCSDAWFLKASAFVNLKNYSEAIKCINEAINIHPEVPPLYYQIKGLILEYLQKPDEAVEAYDEYLKTNPKDANVWNLCGKIYKNSKRYDKAIDRYTKALKLEPNNAEICFNKAYCLSLFEGRIYIDENGKPYDNRECKLKAIDYLDRSIHLDSTNARTWMWKGVTLLDLQKPKEALEALEEAEELDKNNPLIQKLLGDVLSKGSDHINILGVSFDPNLFDPNRDSKQKPFKRNYKRAEKCYKKALERCDYNYADAWDGLGDVLDILGKSKEAQDAHHQAKIRRPPD